MIINIMIWNETVLININRLSDTDEDDDKILIVMIMLMIKTNVWNVYNYKSVTDIQQLLMLNDMREDLSRI